jgi:L-alanine-DL-glutamate epimerase-like enolase superfamily enzyme
MKIEHVDIWRLEIPLTTPYRLAFGPVTHYDTISVDIIGDDGERGFGEATLLTGYTDETIDDGYALATQIGSELPGSASATARARMRALGARAPFVATAFHTALDMTAMHPVRRQRDARRVPMLALLQGNDEAELRDNFERLFADGYRTVKVKVGFDVDGDARHIAAVQRVVSGRAAIRIDANQGYTADNAIALVRQVDPAGIELFEQPCAAGDWDAHRAVAIGAALRDLPLMLDESIYDIADIERAADERASAFIKVKLMKFVGIDALTKAIARIRSLGMQPVLGNGAATDLGCWMEACVATSCIDNAGEMNGFLNAREMLFTEPLVVDKGAIVIPVEVPALDIDALERFARDRASFRARAAR